MARAHGLAILGLVAAGTALWLVLAQPPDPAPPPLSPRPAAGEPRAPVTPATGRQPVPAPEPVPGPAAGPPAPEPPADAPPPAARASVVLRATDLATQQPLAAFRWRFRPGPEDATGAGVAAAPGKGDGAAGEAALALPPGSTGDLLVEADGFAPERFPVALPRILGEPVRIDAFLARAAPLSGVVLLGRDDEGWPVRRMRIDVWALGLADRDPEPGTDPAPPTLWARTGTSEDGRLQLPPLPPGRYALRAQPTADDDTALPLLPWRQVIQFGGSESMAFEIPFARGVVLAITATPGLPARDYTVRVSDAGGNPVPVLWRSRVDETAVVATATVTVPPRATSLLALPPGDYRVELGLGGQPVAVAPEPPAAGVLTFRAGPGR